MRSATSKRHPARRRAIRTRAGWEAAVIDPARAAPEQILRTGPVRTSCLCARERGGFELVHAFLAKRSERSDTAIFTGPKVPVGPAHRPEVLRRSRPAQGVRSRPVQAGPRLSAPVSGPAIAADAAATATAGDHARTGGVVLGLALVTGTLALLASRDAGTGIETGLALSSAALAGSARLGGARLAPAAFDAPSRGHAPRKVLQIALIFCLAFAGLLWLAHPGPGPQELAAFTRSVTPASALLLALSAALLVSVPRALFATALCIAVLRVLTRFF
ncbi:hypothetical protein [Marinicauda pacifica]|uniref:hypothetical protein n=1 Tax=Marinicauda pacifica TaxID=1133559 RepID=UPI0035C8416B